MKKRLLAVLCLVGLLCGCAGLDLDLGETVYGLSHGVYVMETDAAFAPEIAFSMQEKQAGGGFTFAFEANSGYENAGTWHIEDGHVYCSNRDGLYAYVFEVLDNDRIAFVQKGSSPTLNNNAAVVVTDGAVFRFAPERTLYEDAPLARAAEAAWAKQNPGAQAVTAVPDAHNSGLYLTLRLQQAGTEQAVWTVDRATGLAADEAGNTIDLAAEME